MKDTQYNPLVVGLGNSLMSDDGLGSHVVRGLGNSRWPPEVLILEIGISPLYYLKEITNSHTLIVVDAIHADGKPGCIYRFTDKDIICPSAYWGNSHAVSLMSVIALAREISDLPMSVIYYGVEPLNLCFGNRLSTPVKESLGKVIAAVTREIQDLICRQPLSL